MKTRTRSTKYLFLVAAVSVETVEEQSPSSSRIPCAAVPEVTDKPGLVRTQPVQFPFRKAAR